MPKIIHETLGFDGKPADVTIVEASANTKTGVVVTVNVLPRDTKPSDREHGAVTVCGDCRIKKECYVNWGWLYPHWHSKRVLLTSKQVDAIVRHRVLRLTGAGDGALIDRSVTERMIKLSSGHTGYTHQWRDPSNQWMKKYYLASVNTEEEYHQAKALGWKTYRTMAEGEALLPNERSCPHYATGIQCRECQLCRPGRGNKDVATPLR